MSPRPKQIPREVLEVLEAGISKGAHFILPPRQLDRKLYQAVNDVLDALGGKWSRSAKAHIFDAPCADRISDAVDSGLYTRPDDMGWFPTPPELAARVARVALIEPGMAVLEPSAGEGALCAAALVYTGCVAAYELDERRAQACVSKAAVAPIRADFLTVTPERKFDRVIMNPPFARRADIHHVMHARKFLVPGGVLVAIMSGGIEFRTDKLATEFRQHVDTLERLPDGSFTSSGTDVRTVLVTMRAEP